MKNSNLFNYQIIKKVISFVEQHTNEQPSIEEISSATNLSLDQLQKILKQWSGVNLDKFLQYLNIRHVKKLLQTPEQNLFNTIIDTDSFSPYRLHNLFVKIEAISPKELKEDGKNLTIHYYIYSSIFGNILIANTHKGIYHLSFIDHLDDGIQNLKKQLPKATYIQQKHSLQKLAIKLLENPFANTKPLQLHIKGTTFQLQVWETLLKIPLGKLSTYGAIANKLEKPKASRAVGTAVGKNPIAFLIPCHRVVQSTGGFGNYMWGAHRKKIMIGWESAKTDL